MPRAPMPWFRVYTEMMADRKLRRRPPAERWLWVGIMAMGRESPEPGRLLIGEHPADAEDLADYCALPPKVVRSGLAYFLDQRTAMLRRNGDVLEIINWGCRQFASDDVTERTRRFRSAERRRNVPTTPEGTAPETEAETDRSNPPTPTAGAVGERGKSPRRGTRASGSSPRQIAAAAAAQRQADEDLARAQRRHEDAVAFAAEFAGLSMDDARFEATQRWPHDPEQRTKALSQWGAHQRQVTA